MEISGIDAVATVLGKSDPAVDGLLDVAREEFIDHGFRRVSMSDIAARAGVSRRTLYRRFGEKDSLVVAVVEREALLFFRNVATTLPIGGTAVERATEGFVAGVRECRENPLVVAVQKYEPERLATTINRPESMTTVRNVVALMLADESLTYEDALWAAEIMGRITVSLILSPTEVLPVDTDDKAREFARRFFGPLIEAATKAPTAAS